MSLATNVRPHQLDEVLGQDSAVALIRARLNRGDVSPLMLVGPAGCGKTTLARIVAMGVNCENGKEPCMECESCKSILSERSMDVIEVDAATYNKREDIDSLKEKLGYKPFGKCKVLIIDECQQITAAGWAALLKIVEEPPQNVLFSFCTTDPEKIPPAIRSRCQTIELHKVKPSVIEGRLRDLCKSHNKEYEDDALKIITEAANGGMRDALSILEQFFNLEGKITADVVQKAIGKAGINDIIDMITCMINGDVSGIISGVRKLNDSNKSMNSVINDTIRVMEDVLMALNGSDLSELPVTEEYRNKIKAIAGISNPAQLLGFIDRISQSAKESQAVETAMVLCAVHENEISVIKEQVEQLKLKVKELSSLELRAVKMPKTVDSAVNKEEAEMDELKENMPVEQTAAADDETEGSTVSTAPVVNEASRPIPAAIPSVIPSVISAGNDSKSEPVDDERGFKKGVAMMDLSDILGADVEIGDAVSILDNSSPRPATVPTTDEPSSPVSAEDAEITEPIENPVEEPVEDTEEIPFEESVETNEPELPSDEDIFGSDSFFDDFAC